MSTHGTRSEEHTSELQSHSEISYAVFCLKNKKFFPSHDTAIASSHGNDACVLLDSNFYVVITSFFFFNDTATTEIYTLSYTLSLHDALPISPVTFRNLVCRLLLVTG